MAIAMLVLAGTVGLLLDDAQTSTMEIDRDRAAISRQIEVLEQDISKYNGGLLKDFLQLRLSVLRLSDDMLLQKRTSMLRRIDLSYTANVEVAKPATDGVLNDILGEIKQAEARVASSRQEAAKYGAGLLQSVALLKVEADEFAVSELRLRFYGAKHGFPMLRIPKDQKTGTPTGRIVDDKDAL